MEDDTVRGHHNHLPSTRSAHPWQSFAPERETWAEVEGWQRGRLRRVTGYHEIYPSSKERPVAGQSCWSDSCQGQETWSPENGRYYRQIISACHG